MVSTSRTPFDKGVSTHININKQNTFWTKECCPGDGANLLEDYASKGNREVPDRTKYVEGGYIKYLVKNV